MVLKNTPRGIGSLYAFLFLAILGVFFVPNFTYAYTATDLEDTTLTIVSSYKEFYFSTTSVNSLSTSVLDDIWTSGAGATLANYKANTSGDTVAVCSYGGWTADGYWISGGDLVDTHFQTFNIWRCTDGVFQSVGVFQGPTLSVATSTSYFSGQTASTTLQDLASRCSDSSNIFSEGLCMAGVFLFVPDSDTLGQFSELDDTLSAKFPFSYVGSVVTTWQGLTASSTLNSPTYSYNLANLQLGSTTPMGNILPNITAFSSTTVQTYFPAGSFDLLKTLAGFAILLTLIADIFFTSRNLIH